MDFGEELSVEDWTKATNKVTEMVEEAFGGQPEPIQDTTEDKIKKKEEDSEETPEPTTS
jgi:pyruvate/oxaloacetate carboxyltransferase